MSEVSDNGRGVMVAFANHNHAFAYYYGVFKTLFMEISDTVNLETIHKKISTFISEFDYGIATIEEVLRLRGRLREISDEFDGDVEAKTLAYKSNLGFAQQVQYLKKFYYYYLQYLEVVSQFVEGLVVSFMPNTNMQKKILRYSNNNLFFEKKKEYKGEVLRALSDFDIKNFTFGFNMLLTFSYAYFLFINNETKILLDEMFSLILSKFLSHECLSLLIKGNNLSRADQAELRKISKDIHYYLLMCNSLVNNSFSDYGIDPKKYEKIDLDVTGI